MKNETREILLPGGKSQFEQLVKAVEGNIEKALVAGEASEKVALEIAKKFNAETEVIVEDYEAMLNAKLILEESGIIAKIMEFERTDYADETFDLVYAQASVTRESRKKIVKEIKRILKTGGILSAGEIVLLKRNPPQMISDLLDWAGLTPLHIDEIDAYYKQRGFEILTAENFPNALPEYYKKITRIYERRKEDLSEREKSYYKKLIHRISHEANVFLKFGGEKHLSFYAFVSRKI